ncbi:FKBP-type peptidyl-prolyl cis-trans isomerase [Geobacter argillaceus]|uniref:Peptidyl-prolyl cis-trans isomerase n=1 Tax=Geobacter argillaceus TaxID=345631 RepID=A0A562VNG1_9BACT|nr:FKBP-type peptidyl-prolyl cis-trans isomerase [Geobacter argillaceus]TWJ19267.1 peptidylprolyl isomerase [Geobacter argillaceus]
MRGVEKLIIVLLLLMAVTIPACYQKETKSGGEQPAVGQKAPAGMITTPSGLAYQDLVAGSGPTPTAGKVVKVHYTGWLQDGTKFDSSLDRGQPFEFPIGAGQVIPGWDEGVMTMKVGGKRKLVIPPQLGYGAAGAGGVIPPNATLTFEVILLDVQQ